MSIDPVVLALSSPLETETALAAARAVLGTPDPSTELDRLYRALLRHRTLLSAIAHLERAGGDLERIGVSAELFKSSWPLNSLFPPPHEAPPARIPLAGIRARLETHRRLLRKLTAEILAIEPEVVLLFGRAVELAYPQYLHRQDYDVDLFAADTPSALRLLAALRKQLGFALGGCKVSRLRLGWLLRMGLEAASPERHLLHIDVIVGGWPAGPGTLLPPWSLAPVDDRAREIRWEGRRARVPSAEDMLLTLGAKINRHLVSPLVVPSGGLIRKDFNDAMLILTTEGALDWERVLDGAMRLGCRGVLYQLVRDAEDQSGRELAPPRAVAGLAPGAIERRLVGLGGWATEADRAAGKGRARFHRLVLRLWPTFSLIQFILTPDAALGSPLAVVADRLKERVLLLELRLLRSKRRGVKWPIPLLRRLRPRFGLLCEVGGESAVRCPGLGPHRGGPRAFPDLDSDASAVLQAVRAIIPSPAELDQLRSAAGAHLAWKFGHRCERLVFNVGQSGAHSPPR